MGFDILDNATVGQPIGFSLWETHDLYDVNKDVWQKCRDCRAGEEAIKSKGQTYLPKLNGQTDAEYEVYKDRAQFFNGTGRTIEAYLGMIFRKLPLYNFTQDGKTSTELDEYMEQKFLSSVTHDGMDFDTFLHSITEEVITTNRVGILIDMPEINYDNENPLKLSDVEEMNLHPIVSMYKAETIINWHTQTLNGQIVPVFFVLTEHRDRVQPNSLKHELINAYRILYLENWDDMPNRRYKVITVEEERLNPGGFFVTGVTYPRINGEFMKSIPFYVLTDRGLDFRNIYPPMIEDLVNVNIGYYRNSADHENELHWTGIKSIVYPDWDVKVYGQPKVGGALAAPKDCIPVLLEPSADSALDNAMRNKMEQMSILGAERISQKGRYLPSAETARINASTESSVLFNMITYMGLNLSRILQAMVNWAKPWISEWPGELKASVLINSDLDNDLITGADAKNWMDVLLQGGVSWDTYYSNMEKREAYPDGWTKDKEWKSLQITRRMLLDSELIMEPEQPDPQTQSSGTGGDVTVRPIGDKPRVRVS